MGHQIVITWVSYTLRFERLSINCSSYARAEAVALKRDYKRYLVLPALSRIWVS